MIPPQGSADFAAAMEKVRAVANDALRTIEADTAATVARVRVLLLNAWLRPPVVGLSLFSRSAAGAGR